MGLPKNIRNLAINDKTQRRRPVDEVAAEVAKIPDRFVLFVDDNLTADREYAAEMFRTLMPLKKHWALPVHPDHRR